MYKKDAEEKEGGDAGKRKERYKGGNRKETQ